MWYLWYGKWQCKYEKILYNVIQRVKTLFVNKDQKAATVFSICTNHHQKARDGDFVTQVPGNCYLFVANLWLFEQFPVGAQPKYRNLTILEIEIYL